MPFSKIRDTIAAFTSPRHESAMKDTSENHAHERRYRVRVRGGRVHPPPEPVYAKAFRAGRELLTYIRDCFGEVVVLAAFVVLIAVIVVTVIVFLWWLFKSSQAATEAFLIAGTVIFLLGAIRSAVQTYVAMRRGVYHRDFYFGSKLRETLMTLRGGQNNSGQFGGK